MANNEISKEVYATLQSLLNSHQSLENKLKEKDETIETLSDLLDTVFKPSWREGKLNWKEEVLAKQEKETVPSEERGPTEPKKETE